MKISRRTMRCDVPSTAMGDIAFNLLIFFVILARAQDDSHLHWNPAQAEKLESAGNSVVSVLVDSENKLYLNGSEIGISQLAGRIEELLGDMPAGKRTVLLKVHQDILAQRFEPILEAVSEAGGDLVHILEENKTSGTP
ncbi:MAG: biopolymer transporter ExbD [Planctomycetaceae bacterium]